MRTEVVPTTGVTFDVPKEEMHRVVPGMPVADRLRTLKVVE